MQTNDENAIFTLSGFPCAQTAFTTTNYARIFCPNIFIIYRTCGVFLASVTVISPNSLYTVARTEWNSDADAAPVLTQFTVEDY